MSTHLTKGKALSNAMRNGKRVLAGVAAGALGAALLPMVVATSANAATIAGSTTPVRAGTLGTIPPAIASWKNTGTGSINIGDDTLTVALTTAPSASAELAVYNAAGNALDDTVVLNGPATFVQPGNAFTVAGTDDSALNIAVTAAGLYQGVIGDGTDTATFSFTTRGAPASMTLTPASQNILVGGNANAVLRLLDSNGNQTQPAVVDTVALSDNTDDTITNADFSAPLASWTGTELRTGQGTLGLTTAGNAAGTTTITATPQGTLPGSGVTAVQATVTKGGTVSGTQVKSIKVTAPSNADSTPPNSDDTVVRSVDVRSGTSSLTVQVDDTGTTAGNTIRLGVWVTGVVGGTVNGSPATAASPLTIDVTTDSSLRASTTLTLGGAAAFNPAVIEIRQFSVTNTVVGVSDVSVQQVAPVVTAGSITVSPDDSVVAQLGATTQVSVTVEDQFGDPQAGWTVRAFRGADTTGTQLSSGVTDAAGTALVNVTNAAGATNNTVESYSFQAIPPVGVAVDVDNPLQITYTTSGAVTSLTVNVNNPAIAPPITNATTSIPVMPFIQVPGLGVVDSIGTGTFTVATSAGTAGGNYAVFSPSTNPLNAVTVTVPAGVKVTSTNPALGTTIWSSGSQTVTVSSNTPVYVFATAVGTHDVVFTSGGLTATAKIRVATAPQFAYDIAISPASQELAPSAFGTATITVTDVFGNPVPGTADDTGGVTVVATGEVRLGGLASSQAVNTGANGTATVSLIAGNAGEGALAIAPTNATNASNAPAYRPNFTPPVGAPAPVLSGAASVTVTGGPTAQSILILDGYRNGDRIETFGESTGFAMGAILKPWIRFPGQTGFSMGTANILVDDMGDWNWGRKTGKRTAVQIRDEANTVRSNTVVIEAR